VTEFGLPAAQGEKAFAIFALSLFTNSPTYAKVLEK
jgi:hypothetical protein